MSIFVVFPTLFSTCRTPNLFFVFFHFVSFSPLPFFFLFTFHTIALPFLAVSISLLILVYIDAIGADPFYWFLLSFSWLMIVSLEHLLIYYLFLLKKNSIPIITYLMFTLHFPVLLFFPGTFSHLFQPFPLFSSHFSLEVIPRLTNFTPSRSTSLSMLAILLVTIN